MVAEAQSWYLKPAIFHNFIKIHPLVTKTCQNHYNFKFTTFRKLLAWEPLGGAEGRSDTRIRTWILIWLKPFKGGYSRYRRVVNNLVIINHDNVDKFYIIHVIRIDFMSEPIVSDNTLLTEEYVIWWIAFNKTVWAPMSE